MFRRHKWSTKFSMFRERRFGSRRICHFEREEKNSGTSVELSLRSSPSTRRATPSANRTTALNSLHKDRRRSRGMARSRRPSIPRHYQPSAGSRRCCRPRDKPQRRAERRTQNPDLHAGASVQRRPTARAASRRRGYGRPRSARQSPPLPTPPRSAIGAGQSGTKPRPRAS